MACCLPLHTKALDVVTQKESNRHCLRHLVIASEVTSTTLIHLREDNPVQSKLQVTSSALKHRVAWHVRLSTYRVILRQEGRKTDVKSVLVAGGWELGDVSEHVFRKLEVTKLEMELSRTMVTRVADWKRWKEKEVILPIPDPYISWWRGLRGCGKGIAAGIRSEIYLLWSFHLVPHWRLKKSIVKPSDVLRMTYRPCVLFASILLFCCCQYSQIIMPVSINQLQY